MPRGRALAIKISQPSAVSQAGPIRQARPIFLGRPLGASGALLCILVALYGDSVFDPPS
jgi:hypothetical protein